MSTMSNESASGREREKGLGGLRLLPALMLKSIVFESLVGHCGSPFGDSFSTSV
jgi:hypothetical protein